MNAFTQTRNDDTFQFTTSASDFAKTAKVAAAVRADFDAGDAELTVRGDATSNTITIGRDATGTILVNDGTVQVTGGTPTTANTTEIHVLGRGADDIISVVDSGLMPHLTLDGDAGNDTITGSNGNDTLIGGSGDDFINGRRGNDDAQLGSGNDTFVWNPGDGSDTVKGGSGTDTLQFNGANIGEVFDFSASGGDVIMTRNIAAVTMNLDGMETINLVTLGGADTVTVHDLTRTNAQVLNIDLSATPGSGTGDQSADAVILEGSARADTIVAQSAGAETVVTGLGAEVHLTGFESNLDKLTIDGGDGNDTITGSRGADLLIGGNGNDTFIWNPGDGNDTVEGDAGTDTLRFNGSAIGENIDISNNAGRTRFFRDVGAVTMDVNNVENIAFAAGRGADTVIVNDLTGTTVRSVDVDLGATAGGAGDGEADRVIVNGTLAADAIVVKTAGGDTVITGLAAEVRVHGVDAGVDTIQINTLNENDTINATAANGVGLSVNSGAGNDTITMGSGNDLVVGGQGNDTAFLGAGDDTFVWNPGDASDTVEGQAGTDTLQFNGANIAETIDISGNGGRVLMTRNIAAITMDVKGFERINFAALGGTDDISVHDLSGTGVQQVNLDLGATGIPTGDTQADIVRLEGSAQADTASFARNGNEVVVSGLPAEVRIAGFENGLDTLQIAFGAGNDTMRFAGSSVAENIDISANAGGAHFFRDVGNVAVDLSGLENIAFTAAGGADRVTVGDLTGSGVARVDVDLGATPGGAGDGDADTVIVNGTVAADTVVVKTVGTETVVTGLAAEVHIQGADAGVDQLVLNTSNENDTIDASGLAANGMGLQINAGAGIDTITGSAGGDLITGGTGNDVAFMGAGDDTFVWNPGDASDTVEGQAGNDTLQFNGANIAEKIDISANGERVLMTRNIAAITMDVNGLETINFRALGGADDITVHDLTGTGTQQVNIDLGANGGGGDGSADIVNIEATAGNDVITVSVQDGVLVVDGLSSQIRIANFEAGDQIHFLGLDGDDVIEASGVPANGPQLVLDGGAGDDILIGGAGDDILLGGPDDDVLEGGPGQDQLDGGPGNNILIQ